MIIAPAVQGLLVAKVRGIYPSNRLLFGLTCWMITYGTVPLNMSKRSKQMQLREISRNTPKFEKQFLCIPPYFSEFNTSVPAFFVQKSSGSADANINCRCILFFANNAVKQYSCSH